MTTAIYCRISRDREGRELGVERQEAECRELAARLDLTVVEVYTDNDVSASTRSRRARPAYDQMLADARTGRIATILAWSSSRLTRRPMELEAQIQLAEQHGITYRYVKSPSFDLNTAQGRMIARQLAAVDAAEAEMTAERQAAQKRQAALAGRWRGGRRPFGYEADGVTVRPDEAAHLAWAAGQVLLGASLMSIAAELRRRGVTTSTGRQWLASEVRRVLLRARNAGLIEMRGEIVGPAAWEPILPREQWEAVRRVLTDPSRRTNRTNTAKRWLGSGLYLCGVCADGTTVRASMTAKVVHYTCRVSKHVTRPASYVDEVVEAAVLGWIGRPEVVAHLMAGDGEDAEALARRAQELRNRLDEAADAFADGLLDRQQLARVTERVRAELVEVEERLIRSAGSRPAAELARADDLAAAWSALDVSRRQAIVDALAVVTLHQAGRRGRPAGWRPGRRYFDPRTVQITWRS